MTGSDAAEFFAKLDAGAPAAPAPIATSRETVDWIRGISMPPLQDEPPLTPPEPLQLTEDMVVRTETETPEGRTIRYSNWPGPGEDS